MAAGRDSDGPPAQGPLSDTGRSPAPFLATSDREIDRAFRIAVGDLASSIALFRDGLLRETAPVFLAGLDYAAPWTRDAAINVWNGAGLLYPEVSRNTLLSVLTQADGRTIIGGQYNQYWDAIIWAVGAWAYYLYTGDRDFLALAFEAVVNSLVDLEFAEFDERNGLFRGPACYGDGVAAYPDIYARTNGSASILDWPAANPELVSTPGYGLPMQTLSTNCLYVCAYKLLGDMADELDVVRDADWQRKAAALRDGISSQLWDGSRGHFRYFTDPFGGCDSQEGLGHSFALLFGVASPEQSAAIFRSQYITPAGIPCVWPTFGRYADASGMRFGRHSGTVWPHIQGFWAEACARFGQREAFERELRQLASKANRDNQFAELYHPLTGDMYGGAQEKDGPITESWPSAARQTWSATGFLRAILLGLFGMRFEPAGVRFQPLPMPGMQHMSIYELPYRGVLLHVIVEGTGSEVVEFTLNGVPASQPFLPATATGRQEVRITMGAS